MAMQSFERTFTWTFDSPPEAVWPALADTARFNEAAGLPKHAVEERPQADGSVRFFATARKGPFRLEWEEIPVEWVERQWFRHRRVFSAGPLAELAAALRLRADGPGASVVEYTVTASPRNALGWAILRTGFFRAIDRDFSALAAGVREWAAGRRQQPFETPAIALDGPTRARLDATLGRIEASGNGHALAARLADWMLAAQDVDVQRIRPLALARLWAAPPRHVIELCLQAVKEGLLEMSWDLLCPRCRGAKLAAGSLDRLPAGAHCGACNIDYGRDFARNIELSFRTSPSIRAVLPGEFCLFGPMSTPHVKLQIALDPGEERSVSADLAPGDYRLRTLEAGGQSDIVHDGGSFPEIVAADGTVDPGSLARPGEISVRNAGDRRRTIIVESLEWAQDALTAHRVTTLQTFRELFANEALRPGDEVGISHVTLMFTDLKSSTALYDRVGDAAAYRIVREHFAYLAQAVRRADGAVVKTIGDAIMAAFPNPADGVRAALAIQTGIAAFNASIGEQDLVIRIGLHSGPTIAVTLNDRLDYFGTTVNLAARLETESGGGDIVVSQTLLEDPGVAAIMAGHPVSREVRTIRGFERPVEFHRLGPAVGGATKAP